MCIKSVEATAFDMVKALLRGKYADAYGMLDALFAQKTEPVMIAGALISSYIDMYRAKAALASGERVEAVAQAFNYKGREFRLRYAAQDASRLTLAQLGTCLDILSEADEALKSTRLRNGLCWKRRCSGCNVSPVDEGTNRGCPLPAHAKVQRKRMVLQS